MPLFEGSHNFVINGGHFTDTVGSNGGLVDSLCRHISVFTGLTYDEGIQYLAQHIASQATHDSVASRERSTCHPGTRKRVINHIMDWIVNKDDQKSLFWLHGPAGAGKSVIAQTIAVKLSALGVLGASFFFSRTDSTRNTVSQLFLTIAYQLAISWHSAAFKVEIEKAIERDPNVVNQRMELQWEKLILCPLQSVLSNNANDNLQSPMIIVIDGLDECLNEHEQVDILKIFHFSDIRILRILIFSRAEPHLLDSVCEISSITSFGLHRTTEVDDEIKLFLHDNFQHICNLKKYRSSMQRVSDPWPSEEILNKLVAKASGQFIYASTVIKYVQSRKESPITLLNHVLNLEGGHGPFNELDTLYRGILTKTTEDGEQLDQMLTIVGFMLILLKEERRILLPTLSVIEQLLQLCPGEMELIMYGSQSLIHIPDLSLLSTWDVQEPYFHHASLEDFLIDMTRSGPYFVDLNKISERLTNCCMTVLSNRSIQWEYHLHTHVDAGSNLCGYFGWYYSLSTWLDIRKGRKYESATSLPLDSTNLWSNDGSILKRIFDALVRFRGLCVRDIQNLSTEEMPRQLAHNPSLEAFVIINSIMISKLDISLNAEIDLVSQVNSDQRQAFADFLDFLTCNPYINTPFKAILFGYLSEFLHSKIVPSSYLLPGPVKWEEASFARGVFAKVFMGLYGDHKVCVRKDMRYYRKVDKMLYKKLPHPILTSRHLTHPNLIPFYGVEIHPPLEDNDWNSHPVLNWAVCAITPFMEGGNMVEYLNNMSHCGTDVYWLLISDIVSALAHINENGMIIQSWTTEGILISANGRAYVTGFQSSLYSFYEDVTWNFMEESTAKQLKTCARYASPEILNPGSHPLTIKSNIFSFATICYEILTNFVAFCEDSPDIQAITKRITTGGYPTIPNAFHKCWTWNGGPISEAHWNLFLECWNLDPRKRPDIPEIRDRLFLKDIVDARPKDEWGLSARFNDLQYSAQFITPEAVNTLISFVSNFLVQSTMILRITFQLKGVMLVDSCDT
ncbi:hypothetical protein BDQ17DRAFT_1433087 [Cyathus striatus]|nr:hypothetical protein BDQ17DRAFT_1433087 [Cyathus striatus]